MKKIFLTLTLLGFLPSQNFAQPAETPSAPQVHISPKGVFSGKPIMRRFLGTPEERKACAEKGGVWTAARGCIFLEKTKPAKIKPDLTTKKGCDEIGGIWDARSGKCGLRL